MNDLYIVQTDIGKIAVYASSLEELENKVKEHFNSYSIDFKVDYAI
jgi:hypothetical protein